MSDMLARLAARAQESPVVLGRRIGYRFGPAADHQEAWPGEEAWLGEQRILRTSEPAAPPQADGGEAPIGRAAPVARARNVATEASLAAPAQRFRPSPRLPPIAPARAPPGSTRRCARGRPPCAQWRRRTEQRRRHRPLRSR